MKPNEKDIEKAKKLAEKLKKLQKSHDSQDFDKVLKSDNSLEDLKK